MTTKTDKSFDCVKSVRKERNRIAADTEGKSVDEIIKYFRNRKESPKISSDDKK